MTRILLLLLKAQKTSVFVVPFSCVIQTVKLLPPLVDNMGGMVAMEVASPTHSPTFHM